MVLIKRKCVECGKVNEIEIEIKTTDGIVCKLLAYMDLEIEFNCECGDLIRMID